MLLQRDALWQLVEDLEDVGLFSVESLPNGIHLVLWYVRDQFDEGSDTSPPVIGRSGISRASP